METSPWQLSHVSAGCRGAGGALPVTTRPSPRGSEGAGLVPQSRDPLFCFSCWDFQALRLAGCIFPPFLKSVDRVIPFLLLE